MEIERVNVLGVGVSVLDQDRARDFLFAAAREGRRGYVTVTNVHSVSEAQRDSKLREILNNALLATPDGMPLVWMGQMQGHPTIKRVYGPDLVLNLCEHGREFGFRHFFFGGHPGVAQDMATALQELFPNLRVVGTFCPPYRSMNEAELEKLKSAVREARPDFFWVGLGMPKQEFFMAEYLSILPEAKIMIGVGAAFDFFSGRVKQAPRWMMRLGLEWFYRLCQEPRRLWRRYLLNNPLFVARAIAQLTGRRSYKL